MLETWCERSVWRMAAWTCLLLLGAWNLGCGGAQESTTAMMEEYRRMERQVLADPDLTHSLEMINVTDADESEVHERRRRAARRTGCPANGQNWLENPPAGIGLRFRSLSPWKFVRNYDSRRPKGQRVLVDSVCLCDGCIDPETGREVRVGLKSVDIEYKRGHSVLNSATGRYEPATATLHIGCHCVVSEQFRRKP